MIKKVSCFLFFILFISTLGITIENTSAISPIRDVDFFKETNVDTGVERYYLYTLFVSPDGLDSNIGSETEPFRTITKAVEVAQPGDYILVKKGTYIEEVDIEISGIENDPIVFVAEEGVIVEGPSNLLYWSAIFDIQFANYLTFIGFHLNNSNWFGIDIVESSHITIDSCYIENTEASRIHAHVSNNIILTNNKVRNACASDNDPAVGTQECITIASVNTFQVTYNEVFESSYKEGIDAKAGCSNGIIAYNRVHDNINIGIYVDSWNNLLSNVQVYGNILYNNGHHGIAVSSEDGGVVQNVAIFNNLIYDNDRNGIIISGWVRNGLRKNISIISNTVINNGWLEDWGGGITIQDYANLNGATIRNNIVSDNSYWQIMADFPDKDIICDHNLIDGFRGYTYETKGMDYQEGDPGFITQSGNDFILSDTSIAIDAGSPLSAPNEDFTGNKRPYGNEIDIGAIEFVAPIYINGNDDFHNTASSRNWEGDGSPYNPYIIKGLKLSFVADNLIEIRNTDVHFLIVDCSLSNGINGIHLYNVTNGNLLSNTVFIQQSDCIFLQNTSSTIIEKNTAYNSTSVGIQVYRSNGNTIANNSLFSHKLSGIKLFYSDTNLVEDNTVTQTNIGIEVTSSNDNVIANNSAFDNQDSGIKLISAYNNDISGNTVHDNAANGIYLGSSNYNVISDNIIDTNPNEGIYLENSDHNVIVRNNFVSGPQANDGGSNNVFILNYWSGWTSPDANEDGIVDNPYSIGSENQDPYPLVSPETHALTPPVVSYPNGEEALSGIITVQWAASVDSFGHSVTYAVYYSANGVNSWIQLESSLAIPSYNWDTTTVTDGNNYLIKVVTTCSDGLSEKDISDAQFVIQNVEATPTTTIGETTSETDTTTTTTTPTRAVTPGWIVLLSLFVTLLFRHRRKRS